MRLLVKAAGAPGTLYDAGTHVALGSLRHGTTLGGRRAALSGRVVLVSTDTQLAAALALIELDGLARRIVIAPPDLPPAHLPAIAGGAGVDAVVTDRPASTFDPLEIPLILACAPPVVAAPDAPAGATATEWVMLTSGTTGAPKMVVHSHEGLTGAIKPVAADAMPPVWATFYDIRRYGGLQILLRAVLGSGSLVLSQAGEPVADHLLRLGRHDVTHVSGTPSHWRRALMSPEHQAMSPQYIRLSGEIADQSILDGLRRAYPRAAVGHAYASTEAGVGFEVTDGLEGFPASLLDDKGRGVDLKVEDGSLRIRSVRTASRYLGEGAPRLVDAEGFVDTDDMVERRGNRYFFVGRRSGIINVGGLKVHPEEVEAVINRHGDVRMSLVKARSNPITGAIVVADVVLNEVSDTTERHLAALKGEILGLCRAALPQHKVPVLVRFIPHLDVTPAGKLARPHA